MKDEIKEILDSIQEHLKENEENFKKGAVDSTVYYLYCDDARILLDYINNLQERINKDVKILEGRKNGNILLYPDLDTDKEYPKLYKENIKLKLLIDDKDKEIEKLNEELGDANYTITQLHKVMDRHYVKKEDYDRLNNIIDELEKDLTKVLEDMYNSLVHIDGKGYYSESLVPLEDTLDKLKELKGE